MTDMKKILNMIFIQILMLSILSGAAYSKKRGKDPSSNPEPDRKKRKTFLILNLHHPITSDDKSLYRQILSSWWDIFSGIKDADYGEPYTINISAYLVSKLNHIELQDPGFPDIIEKETGKLSKSEQETLMSFYNASVSSSPSVSPADRLLAAQIHSIFAYLGTELSKDDLIEELKSLEEYTEEDKEELLIFAKEKIRQFSYMLKDLLEDEDINEATTSLSDAHMALLDEERVKAQVLESMVNYRRWRGRFPDGFVPHDGYISSQLVEQIEKTSIQWIAADIDPEQCIKTIPQLLPADSFFFSSKSTDAVLSFLNEESYSKSPIVIIGDLAQYRFFLEDKFLHLQDNEHYREEIVDDNSGFTVTLTTSSFVFPEPELGGSLKKIKKFISETQEVIYRYRNSGKANLEAVIDIQEKLLIAESGELYGNLGNTVNERMFRQALVDIYRAMKLAPPLELFFSLKGVDPEKPLKELSGISENIVCDGILGEEEWSNAMKLNFSSNTDSGHSLEAIYTAMSKENLFFAAEFSTGSVPSSLSVILGHMNARAASFYPRNSGHGLENIQDFPLLIEQQWRKKVPEKTVIYRSAGNERWEALIGNYDVNMSTEGVIEFSLPLKYLNALPKRSIYLKFLTEGSMIPPDGYYIIPAPDFELAGAAIFYLDPEKDNFGPGDYSYPSSSSTDTITNYDLKKIDISSSKDEKLISLEFSSLDNPLLAPNGFSFPGIDVYIDVNSRVSQGKNELMEDINAYTVPENAWEFCIRVNGWKKEVYSSSGRMIGEAEVNVSPWKNSINIIIKDSLISASLDNWTVIPVIYAVDTEGNTIRISKGDTAEDLFTGRKHRYDPNIIDLILPAGYIQEDILSAGRRGKSVTIPGLAKNR
jgi:hypothetical protein